MLVLIALLAVAPPAPAAPSSSSSSSSPSPSPPQPSPLVMANAVKLRDRALAGESVAWDVLASLTTEVGARPAGSPAMTRARDWALAKLKALGFKNVHAEDFIKKNAWLRGAESAAMTAPYPMALSVLALGNSVATPPAGIEAEIVVFKSLEELVAAKPGSLSGKIAVVDQPMVRTQSGEGYGSAVKVRGAGPSLAAARGAVAFLTRSIATGTSRAPHTGATHYEDGASAAMKIPAAALGVADADLLAGLAARGPVRVSLSLASSVIAEAPAWNVVGEVPGKDSPSRSSGVIVVGGHLDSWDPGQGAIDDGAGVAITVAAAKLVADNVRPKRTIRVVLFGSEETGGSGEAYAKAHASEVPGMVLASESDLGQGPIYRLAMPKAALADPALTGLATTLAPLHVFIAQEPPRFGGSDMEELEQAGVPIIEYDADATHYFDVHHSADDTFDKVNRADLEQSVAAWAVLLSYVADSGVDLRSHGPDAAVTPKP